MIKLSFPYRIVLSLLLISTVCSATENPKEQLNNWFTGHFKQGKKLFIEKVRELRQGDHKLFIDNEEALTFYKTLKKLCKDYIERQSKEEVRTKKGRGYTFESFDFWGLQEDIKKKTTQPYALNILPYSEVRGEGTPLEPREIIESSKDWFHNSTSEVQKLTRSYEKTLSSDHTVTHEKNKEISGGISINAPTQIAQVTGSFKMSDRKTKEEVDQKVSSFGSVHIFSLPAHSSVKVERVVYQESYLIPYFHVKRITGNVAILIRKNVVFGTRPKEIKVVSLKDILEDTKYFSYSGQENIYEPVEFDGEVLILRRKVGKTFGKIINSESMKIYSYFGDKIKGDEDEYIEENAIKPISKKEDILSSIPSNQDDFIGKTLSPFLPKYLAPVQREPGLIKTKSFRPPVKFFRAQDATFFNVKVLSTEKEEEKGRSEEKKTTMEDKREYVKETHNWPYSVHGVVFVNFKNMVKGFGTGTLIAPNLVLTAAHNLYSHEEYEDEKNEHKKAGRAEKVMFIPAANGNQQPFKKVDVRAFYYPKEYEESTQFPRKEDYGLLVLEDPIGEEIGYFGLSILSPDKMKALKVNVTGYPADKVKDKPFCYEMWGMSGYPLAINSDYITYEICTYSGQAGAGVWYQEGEGCFVVGVHVLGGEKYNQATLLTESRYEQLMKWAGESIEKRLQDKIYEGVKEIDLEGKYIGDFGIEKLCDVIYRDLHTLKLQKNNISGGGANCFALAQDNFPKLTSLDLGWNNIGDEGAKALSLNTTLTSLYLSNNQIGDEGAKALSNNATFTTLDVSKNKIGDEGAKALSLNTTLTSLHLSDNQIGDEGAKALSTNTTFTTLDVSKNKIGDEGAKILAQNIILAQLNLESNNIGDKTVALVMEILKGRKAAQNLQFQGDFKGMPMTFYLECVQESKDSGFAVLGISRKEVIEHLTADKTVGNNLIRQLVAPEIKAAFEEDKFPEKMKNTKYKRLKKQYDSYKGLEKELNDYFLDEDIFVDFIEAVYGQEGKELSYNLIKALAEIRGFSVYVWSLGQDNKTLNFIDSYLPQLSKPEQSLHVLHKENHYYKLQVIHK